MTSFKQKNFFITGTDTHVGKTLLATAFIHYLNNLKKTTIGFKPLSSGCIETPYGLYNQDALDLQSAAGIKIPYREVNPYAFKEPIAPHIAAKQAQQTITAKDLIAHYEKVQNYQSDHIIIEGAGGWRVPLNKHEYISDFVKTSNLSVILVVGVRLGCINHALLTYEALQKDGIQLSGWVANTIEHNMLFSEENIAYLREVIQAPLLGSVPFNEEIHADWINNYLSFKSIL